MKYKDLPIGMPVELPPVPIVEGQAVYVVEIPDLFPGGEYMVSVQAWQNISGEAAGSSVQEITATTSKF